MVVVCWEGVLGGLVYVSTFAKVRGEVGRRRGVVEEEGEGGRERDGEDEEDGRGDGVLVVEEEGRSEGKKAGSGDRDGDAGAAGEEREFALGAVSVSDSAGIMIAGLVGLWLEGAVCKVQVGQGRPYCQGLEVKTKGS